MATPVSTLGPEAIRPLTIRVFRLPVAIALLSVGAVILTHRSGWLSVGGAFISALGARHWASRLFRDPQRSDAGLSPMTLPDPQGRGPRVIMNEAALNELDRRACDNWCAYLGVWLTIGGGILGSAAPFIVDLVWPAPR